MLGKIADLQAEISPNHRVQFSRATSDLGVFCHRLDSDWSRLKANYPPDVQKRIEGREVLNRNGGVSVAPGLWWGYSPLEVKGDASEPGFELCTYVMHFVTPETATTAHYWWALFKEIPFVSEEAKQATHKLFSSAFDEDTVAIKNMQKLLASDKRNYEELNIAGDRAGMLFRREMLAWVKDEYPAYR